MDQDTDRVLNELPQMRREQLVEIWKKYFGKMPHPHLRCELMRPVLAYRMQEKLHRIDAKRVSWPSPRASTQSQAGPMKSGTRIVREWRGVIHEVSVTPEGYEYDGLTYKGLSAIANLITGTRWSGPAFFGTRPRGKSK
jgi:hypothetical protein